MSQLKLEVGKTYISTNGFKHKIIFKNEGDLFLGLSTTGPDTECFQENGKCFKGQWLDIVKEYHEQIKVELTNVNVSAKRQTSNNSRGILEIYHGSYDINVNGDYSKATLILEK